MDNKKIFNGSLRSTFFLLVFKDFNYNNFFINFSAQIPTVTPHIINNEDRNETYDNFSFRNNILIVSAITGTNNWTSAAIVFSNKGKILYHKEYPRADIIAPEQIANKKPIKLNFITSGNMTKLKKNNR